MIQNTHRLWSQVALLRTLMRHTADVGWAREAIQDATNEIERLAPDDVAAEFAQNIRLELAQLSPRHVGVVLSNTGVADAVEVLAHYADMMATSSEHFQKPLRGF